MKCSKCGGKSLIVEGLGDGKTKIVCQDCGFSEIVDKRGLPMLTEVPQPDQRRLLTEDL